MFNIQILAPIVPYGANTYLLSSCGEYAVIDPSSDFNDALEKYPDLKGNLRYVLLTHAHFDHFLTINEWSAEADRIIIGHEDGPALSDAVKNCYLGFLGIDDGYYGEYETVSDGDSLSLGDISLSVISCPGHTPGGVSYKVNVSVFCGDTLFANGGYGRCDLPGGDVTVLEQTLIKLTTYLPTETVFYPGHGPSTNLKEFVYNFM